MNMSPRNNENPKSCLCDKEKEKYEWEQQLQLFDFRQLRGLFLEIWQIKSFNGSELNCAKLPVSSLRDLLLSSIKLSKIPSKRFSIVCKFALSEKRK